MDLEKTKKNYQWDPMRGDYSKSDVSYERRLKKNKQKRNFYLFLLYIFIMIMAIYIIYLKTK